MQAIDVDLQHMESALVALYLNYLFVGYFEETHKALRSVLSRKALACNAAGRIGKQRSYCVQK